MKHLVFKVSQLMLDSLLRPIRDKRDMIGLLVDTTKLMLINHPPPEDKIVGEVHLVVSNMSRIFVFSENKYVSFGFPFTVVFGDERLVFSSKHVETIDNKITSFIHSCLSDEGFFSSNCVFDFISPISQILELEINFWMLMRELLTYEDGYIRYDHDEQHVNGDIHPLHHYDVFYSNKSKFKVGLRDKPDFEKMIDFLKSETDCNYLV